MNLETAKGQEKEEKLRWKKEHTRLKVQSILFTPTSPIAATDTSEVVVPPTPQLLLVQEQLSAMENYAKELSEDVLQKDEKLSELKSELGAVKGWADGFEASLQQAKKDSSPEAAATIAEKTLQEQLSRLQSMIEADYKDSHAHADELQVKIDLLTEENLALVTATSAPCKTCSSDYDTSSSSATSSHSSPLGLTEQQQQERQARRSWCARSGFSSSRKSIELHNVLRESLWELDRQIELDERLSTFSSSTSDSSSTSSSCRNSSASSVSSAFSLDNTNANGSVKQAGNESALVISRRFSSRNAASSSSSSCSTGRLSRTSSSSSSSKFGLREQVLTRDMCSSPEIVGQGLGLVVECEDVGEEDEEKAEGLDAIVKEVEQIVMHQQ